MKTIILLYDRFDLSLFPSLAYNAPTYATYLRRLTPIYANLRQTLALETLCPEGRGVFWSRCLRSPGAVLRSSGNIVGLVASMCALLLPHGTPYEKQWMCNTVLWTPMPHSLVVSMHSLATGIRFHNVLHVLYCCRAELHTKNQWFRIGTRLINEKFSKLKTLSPKLRLQNVRTFQILKIRFRCCR